MMAGSNLVQSPVYIKVADQVVGPVPWPEFRSGLQEGTYQADMPIRFEDSPIWTSYSIIAKRSAATKGTKTTSLVLMVLALGIAGGLTLWKPAILLLSGFACLLLGSSARYAMMLRASPFKTGLGVGLGFIGFFTFSDQRSPAWVSFLIYAGLAQWLALGIWAWFFG